MVFKMLTVVVHIACYAPNVSALELYAVNSADNYLQAVLRLLTTCCWLLDAGYYIVDTRLLVRRRKKNKNH